MKIKYLTFKLIAFMILTVTSCSEDFTNRTPVGRVTLENYYQNEEDALRALTATYAQLRAYNNHDIADWFIGDMVSDDAELGVGNSRSYVLAMRSFSANGDISVFNDRWRINYSGIYRANQVIERVSQMDLTNEDPAGYNIKERIIAEATFLRGYYYYMLVKWFGGVPLITHTQTDPDEFIVPRASVEEVWTQIENDFKEAALHLPHKDEYSSADEGRVTWGTAQAMLVKSYIFQEKWEEAQAAAEILIDSEDYYLADDYASIWTEEGENGPGSIFELQAIYIPGATTATLGLRISEQQSGFKLGYDNPTQDLYDEFEEGDPRLHATIIEEGVNDSLTSAVVEGELYTLRYTFNKTETGYYAKKYQVAFEIHNVSWAKNHPANIRLIRYADVLLWHAEAAYHNGDEVAARESLNKVRARARGNNTDILPDVSSSGEQLLDAIFHERRVELAMEGHRYYDIIRSGKANEIFNDKLGWGYVEGVHDYLPIPQEQIDLAYGAIEPNPYNAGQ